MNYFEQTKLGEARWWSWVIVTWLAFVSWVIFQSLLLLPLFDAMLEVPSYTSVTSERAVTYQKVSLYAAIAATLAALIAIPLNKPSKQDPGVFSDVPTQLDEPVLRNIGIFIIIAVIICFVASRLASTDNSTDVLMQAFSDFMAGSPFAFAIFLLTFPVGLIGLYLGQKYFHHRSLKSLHSAAQNFRWIRIVQGFFLTWVVLGGFSLIADALGFMDVKYVFNGGKFWIYAAISLLFIPLQSATEEIVFRGYFNQGLTHFLNSKWIVFAITSFAFMALHLSNPEALEGAASGTLPIVMSGYFFFGFAMCLIVWIDDGLETAIGIHAGNNCFAAVIMNYENSVLPTPSIFLTGSDPVKDAISTVVVLGILVVIIWRLRGGSENPALS